MVELQQLGMQYSVAGSSLSVLEQLDLSVAAGERVAIVGPSGSGKTTLLLLLTGLEQPTSGRVVINGTSLDQLDADQRADLRRSDIGIVFQSFHLIPTLSAVENVALPLDIDGQKNTRQTASDMLEDVGLGHRLHHYPSQLSGGEQQRVAVARALVHKPPLLVADEPTGNLDEHTGDKLMHLLFDLNTNTGGSLVLVTHDMALAAQCDRQLRLHEGRLQALAES